MYMRYTSNNVVGKLHVETSCVIRDSQFRGMWYGGKRREE